MALRICVLLVFFLTFGCDGRGSGSSTPVIPSNSVSASDESHQVVMRKKRKGFSTIQHVVVIIQENRSFDNFFQGFPGANTQNYGLNHLGQQIPLQQTAINAGFDPSHLHQAFVAEADYNASNQQYQMDGWDLEVGACTHHGVSCDDSVYTYVQQSDVANYWSLASAYALGDETFGMNMGPSWTAHQYLIAGQGGAYNSTSPYGFVSKASKGATCFSPDGKVPTVDFRTSYPGTPGPEERTCSTYPTLFDEMDAANVAWKYYAHSKTNAWTGVNAIMSLYNNDQSKIILPETTVLSDITSHQLASVSYVTPNNNDSDHPFGKLTNHGQDWVALITNELGADPYYWTNTVVIVTWDEWGGFFDHVPPPFAFNPLGGTPDPNEYGFRVPFIVIGAYVKPGLVDHTVRSDGSILTFIENVFNLPSLGTLDAQTDNLAGDFNFSEPPNQYVQLPTHGFTPTVARKTALTAGPADTDL